MKCHIFILWISTRQINLKFKEMEFNENILLEIFITKLTFCLYMLSLTKSHFVCNKIKFPKFAIFRDSLQLHQTKLWVVDLIWKLGTSPVLTFGFMKQNSFCCKNSDCFFEEWSLKCFFCFFLTSLDKWI